MKKTVSAVLIFCFSVCSFSDVEGDIRNYISEIENTQKKMASIMVLQNFSNFFIESLPQEKINEVFGHFLNKDGLSSISNRIFDITFSDDLNAEKINQLTTVLLTLRNDRKNWVSLGENLQDANLVFQKNFSKGSGLCSENSFNKSLAFIDKFSPADINTSGLGKTFDVEIGAKVTYFYEGGDVSYDGNVSATFDGGADSANMRHAATTNAVAASTYLPPPYNVVGAVAAVILIEVVWGMIDMEKHLKELEKIADANQDLHKAFHLEVNLKKYFSEYCVTLESAYLDAAKLIANGDSEAIKSEITKLNVELGEDFDINNLTAKLIYEDTKTFYTFFKLKTLSESYNQKINQVAYYSNWKRVMDLVDNNIRNLEKAITQLVRAKNYSEFSQSSLSKYDQIIKSVVDFTSFRTSYHNLLLTYFDSSTVIERKQKVKDLMDLIANYISYNSPLSVEEEEFVKIYEIAVTELTKDGI